MKIQHILSEIDSRITRHQNIADDAFKRNDRGAYLDNAMIIGTYKSMKEFIQDGMRKTGKAIKDFTFAGLRIASANVCFNGQGFAIMDSLFDSSYGKCRDKEISSTYFNFNEAKEIDIEGWRVPTQKEWAAIIGTKRKGATYNGQEHACFALIQIEVPFGKRKVCNGLLLFPDEVAINGIEIGNINKTFGDDQKNYRQTQNITETQLNDLLAQGCAFLPASGGYYLGEWYDGGSYGTYWSSTKSDEYNAYGLYFYGSGLNPEDYGKKENYYYSVRLVRE